MTLGKGPALPSVGTRQRPGVCRVPPVMHPANPPLLRRRHPAFRRVHLFDECFLAVRKIFVESSSLDTCQPSLCRNKVCRVRFAECYTRQSLCRVFKAFAECPGHSAKVLFPVVKLMRCAVNLGVHIPTPLGNYMGRN